MSEQNPKMLEYGTPQPPQKGCGYQLAFFLLCSAGLLVGLALVITTGALASPPRYVDLAIFGAGLGIAITGAIVLKLKFKMNGLLAALLCIVSIGALLLTICGSL